MDITTMSNRQLKSLINEAQIELQDRHYRIMDDAITHNLYVSEIEPKFRQEYIDYLEEMAGPGESPVAQEILADWWSQEEIIQSRKTTGA